MQTLQHSLAWTTTSCIAVKQARCSRDQNRQCASSRSRTPPPAGTTGQNGLSYPYVDSLQALADLLYQLLAALVLAVRAKLVALLIAVDGWSDDDDSECRKHQRHSVVSGRAGRSRLSPPPPCDGEFAPGGAWWRPAVLLPPQAPHLIGRLTVSRGSVCMRLQALCALAVLFRC